MVAAEKEVETKRVSDRTRSIIFSVVVIIVLVGRLVIVHRFPELEKHVDGITVSLALLAALPWVLPLIAPWISTIEVLGFKIGLRLDELETKINATNTAANAALGAASSPTNLKLDDLINEYYNIREQPPSFERTAKMSRVVGKMSKSEVPISAEDVRRDFLESDEHGRRLFAYCYFFAHPNCEYLKPIYQVIAKYAYRDNPFSESREGETPFGQYWAIQALSQCATACKEGSVDRGLIEDVRKLMDRPYLRGTDRAGALQGALTILESKKAKP